MPASLRSVLVALVPLALTACPKPGPPPTSVSQTNVTATTPAPTTTPGATCLLGDFRVQIQQRMIQDDGVTALLEDQRIGSTAVLFTAQRDAIASFAPGPDPGARPRIPQPPQTLLVARGTMVTQTLDDLFYLPNGGAKPTATGTRSQPYTFFLADAAWDCSSVTSVRDLQLPAEPSAAACLSDTVRAGCQPVRFDA
ncbi:MAG: hypothetical protein JNK56_02220 [Myxococcales bacterium]|nr:hypothetical protein [Myxococcales bacterium]